VSSLRHIVRCFVMFSTLLLLSYSAGAADQGAIHGHVVDPLGASVSGAQVILRQKDAVVSRSTTDAGGNFAFTELPSGEYSVHAEASGFDPVETDAVFLYSGRTVRIPIVLRLGSLQQQIVVSATGTAVPETQVGASVNVIDFQRIQDLAKPDLLETLRTVPGVQVVQTAQRGGTTAVIVRGGNSAFNKVLVDGIPMNDIGSAAEFANIAASGVDHVEIFQGPNSVLYGADALGSVINITTQHGRSTIPVFTYSADGGNFGTYRQDVSLAGAYRKFDYFSDYSRFDTQNSVPNSAFHNGSYTGNFGWSAGKNTDVRLTVRHTAVGVGDPNALDFFRIADDSKQDEHDTYVGATLQNQTTEKWNNLVRFASTQLQFHFVNPTPTGTPFDPFGFGPNYLGNVVTIHGANGFSATGQAILDFGGQYPQPFDSHTTKQSLFAQSSYSIRPNVVATVGLRYENERGSTDSQGSISSTSRNNYGAFLEAHGSLRHRLYATAGVGLEHNAVFGFAATPRVSLAYYLRRPMSDAFLGSAKLKFNYGRGIKEPSIFDQSSSLFNLLSGLPQGASLISKFGVSPVGPERSESFDFGIEQGVANERVRLSLIFFHNRFFDVIEFVGKGALPQLGVPSDVANATPFGATVNSFSFRALGAEADIQAKLIRGLNLEAWYAYVDPVVTASFSSSALNPAFNPAFPDIPIGTFAPLVGGRPFRVAPHSGGVVLSYSHRHFVAALGGYFVSRQDDSTFLSDASFGNSLLLPNRNLNPGYQKIDLSGSYALNSHVSLYSSIENLLSEHYQGAFGFPALPLSFRSGVKFTIGGEEWTKK
jgi:vitamin B12 transporter